MKGILCLFDINRPAKEVVTTRINKVPVSSLAHFQSRGLTVVGCYQTKSMFMVDPRIFKKPWVFTELETQSGVDCIKTMDEASGY
jgi:hypothetical protein